MAVVKAPNSFQGVKSLEDLARFLTNFTRALLQQVNGNLNFVQNISAYGPVSVVFATANSDVVVPHTLNRSPGGFIVINASKAMRVFQGNGTWTNTQIFLQSDTIATATIYVI
jgi:hypothetical protein